MNERLQRIVRAREPLPLPDDGTIEFFSEPIGNDFVLMKVVSKWNTVYCALDMYAEKPVIYAPCDAFFTKEQCDAFCSLELFSCCRFVDLCHVADIIADAVYEQVLKLLKDDGLFLDFDDWWGLLYFARTLSDSFSPFDEFFLVYKNIHACPTEDELDYIARFDIRLDNGGKPYITDDDPRLSSISHDMYVFISDALV